MSRDMHPAWVFKTSGEAYAVAAKVARNLEITFEIVEAKAVLKKAWKPAWPSSSLEDLETGARKIEVLFFSLRDASIPLSDDSDDGDEWYSTQEAALEAGRKRWLEESAKLDVLYGIKR